MTLRRTPLYDIHSALGARFVDFAGWEMPVRYGSLVEEHLAVRRGCGLFDVSHMGEIELAGPGALEAVQYLTTNDIERIGEGQCQYTLVCYPNGGVVDDTIVYRFSNKKFLFCVNASNTEKVYRWMTGHNLKGVEIRDVSAGYAQIALQGPASPEVIRPLLDKNPSDIKGFHFALTGVATKKALVSRTGYTGEDGFEIYVAPEDAARVWQALMDSGRAYGIVPVGLGARDTLRLEMGYPLYGHELTAETTPVEAGLKRFVSFEKGRFIGREVLQGQAREGVTRRLIGYELAMPGIAREGARVFYEEREVGRVTSGTMSPCLRRAIGMAYVEPAVNSPGTAIEIDVRGRRLSAHVVKPPFYKKTAPESQA